MRFLLRVLLLPLLFGVLAQTPAFAQPKESQEMEVSRPRRQVTTIVFAGLAGAVLGLSTLSFYGRPQDKLSNIAIGFALGIITGAVYTTFKAATNPYDPYAFKEWDDSPPIIWSEMYEFPQDSYKKPQSMALSPQLGWTWSF